MLKFKIDVHDQWQVPGHGLMGSCQWGAKNYKGSFFFASLI